MQGYQLLRKATGMLEFVKDHAVPLLAADLGSLDCLPAARALLPAMCVVLASLGLIMKAICKSGWPVVFWYLGMRPISGGNVAQMSACGACSAAYEAGVLCSLYQHTSFGQ